MALSHIQDDLQAGGDLTVWLMLDRVRSLQLQAILYALLTTSTCAQLAASPRLKARVSAPVGLSPMSRYVPVIFPATVG